KQVLPRHLGILGTTGGGKSTTVSGLLGQIARGGGACVILDTEGEYTAINEPTEDPRMLAALEGRGIQPGGITNTRVFHLVGREPANSGHPNLTKFSLRFDELSPHAVMEILDLSDAQQQRFLQSYDQAKIALGRFNVFPSNPAEQAELLELDELDRGYPRMELNHLYDVVACGAALADKSPTIPNLASPVFQANEEQLWQLLSQAQLEKHVASWRALQGRLGRLRRLGIFDTNSARPIPYQELLKPGTVSIIDLSDTDSPQVNNLTIAQLLRGLQRAQEEAYEKAVQQGQQPTLLTLLIEEAHEFLSAERIRQMPVLFAQVARIARRGRKRWFGLVFITQLPQHLPDEVLGLINNWILHKIADSNVISRLRRSIGGVDEGLWSRLPNLAPGQAVVSVSGHTRPLLTSIDPTPVKLRMVD
ncbi:MAG: ATP-binding protein, partial [Dehalococcoidia bacterium]